MIFGVMIENYAFRIGACQCPMHSAFCDTHRMANVERASRLREARKKAKFASAAAAAASMGIKYSTYAGHENGNRAFENDAAQTYSRKFKVRLEWLLTGRGEREAEFSLPAELEQKLLRKSEATRLKVYKAMEPLIDAFPDDGEVSPKVPEVSSENGGMPKSLGKTRGRAKRDPSSDPIELRPRSDDG